MTKLLTIAIPTFNRAARLDRQLAWLDRNIERLESQCAVIVSDNASTDSTPQICEKWRSTLAARGVEVHVVRNPSNIGPLGNIASCITKTESRFVWVIGDDDEIPDEKLAWIVMRLHADPELASIVLNFEGVGKTVYPRCFRFDADQLGDGKKIVSECLRQAYFGLAFMTAQIYRTEFAKAALRAWPESSQNYDGQIFLTAYTAMMGRALATRETHVKYVTGDNVYEKNPRVGMTLYADSLDVFLQLHRVGFSSELCLYLAWRHAWGLKKRFLSLMLVNNPAVTLRTAFRVIGSMIKLCALHAETEEQRRQEDSPEVVPV